MRSTRWIGLCLGLMLGCGTEETSDAPAANGTPPAASKTESADVLPSVVNSLFSKEQIHSWATGPKAITWYADGGLLNGKPTILLSQSIFEKKAGKTVPLPAHLEILTLNGDSWEKSDLNDPEGAVFHKAIIWDDGIMSITGGMPNSDQKGHLKHWTLGADGWTAETIWTGSWDGKKQRLRDFEIGDVDGDGQDEMVVATHDQGVIVVLENVFNDEAVTATELDLKANTYVHEIEIGDVDGDGKLEFFATPSDPNKAKDTQKGDVVMYRYDGQSYVRTVVDATTETHAKEILVADMDGDGVDEVFSAVEAVKKSGKRSSNVEIRQFDFTDGKPSGHRLIADLDDEQLRNMMAYDFNGNGRKELVVAPFKTGLYLLSSQDGQSYEVQRFEDKSAGFEHTANVLDIDQDGTSEIYVADDDHSKSLNRYTWK